MDGLSKGTTPVFGAGALEQFDLVLSTAPRQYKLCQAAYAGRSESARAIGEGGGSDALRQWLWGRGTSSWNIPSIYHAGHYLLCYILARPAFTATEDTAIQPDKKEQQTAALAEVVVLFVLLEPLTGHSSLFHNIRQSPAAPRAHYSSTPVHHYTETRIEVTEAM
eukprot:1194937-Prorocentrum_minimum.AAC.3